MHRGRERTSYIPFLLNPETRLEFIPVRLHFCETIPQARQPISHQRVCVNNGMVKITHFKQAQAYRQISLLLRKSPGHIVRPNDGLFDLIRIPSPPP